MENFVLNIRRKESQFRPVMLNESTYSLLQEAKEKTNIPISQIADKAVCYALERMEIKGEN